MIKNLKSIIKRLFWKFGFKIEKVVIPEEYNLTAPELPLLKCLTNSKGILQYNQYYHLYSKKFLFGYHPHIPLSLCWQLLD